MRTRSIPCNLCPNATSSSTIPSSLGEEIQVTRQESWHLKTRQKAYMALTFRKLSYKKMIIWKLKLLYTVFTFLNSKLLPKMFCIIFLKMRMINISTKKKKIIYTTYNYEPWTRKPKKLQKQMRQYFKKKHKIIYPRGRLEAGKYGSTATKQKHHNTVVSIAPNWFSCIYSSDLHRSHIHSHTITFRRWMAKTTKNSLSLHAGTQNRQPDRNLKNFLLTGHAWHHEEF